jgi:hypothetical protein
MVDLSQLVHAQAAGAETSKMKPLWLLIKAHPIAAALAVLAVVVLVWYFSGSIRRAVLDHKTDRAVDKLERESNDLQQKANQQVTEAEKASGARAAEDERREVEIKPQIAQAARNRETARAATRKAETDYDKSRKKSPPNNGDPDLRALHERNCRDFANLYPDEPDCR